MAALTEKIIDGYPLRSLAVAGGDTSSVVSRRLGLESLIFEGRLDAGVCVCRTHSADPSRDGLRLLLKGGQVGGRRIFDTFAAMI
ncbi:MAG: nucleotide-binding domain containing protein [Aliihoeflea sp.]|uniref:nucleotide-binding domain containing protein n=1 Tax=Aliihoeflea sp. TaxID=2608088 RepID=UPI004033F201